MHIDLGNDLYDIILRSAALPVLALVIALCWLVTNFIMSPRWQQARRNKQIRKAVAARQARSAASMSADKSAASDESQEK